MIDLKQPNYYQDVKQFHQTFHHPGADHPTPIPLARGIKRATWTAEEAVVEFLHQSSRDENEFLASIESFKTGLDRAVEKSLRETYPTTEVEQLVGQGDALTDALYFIMGSFVEAGLEPDISVGRPTPSSLPVQHHSARSRLRSTG